jgi:hypothetical protein
MLIFSGSCSEVYADEASDSFAYEITPYLWAASIVGSQYKWNNCQ